VEGSGPAGQVGQQMSDVPDTRVGGECDLEDGDDVANPITSASDDTAIYDLDYHQVTTAGSRSTDHRMLTAHQLTARSQLMVTRGGGQDERQRGSQIAADS